MPVLRKSDLRKTKAAKKIQTKEVSDSEDLEVSCSEEEKTVSQNVPTKGNTTHLEDDTDSDEELSRKNISKSKQPKEDDEIASSDEEIPTAQAVNRVIKTNEKTIFNKHLRYEESGNTRDRHDLDSVYQLNENNRYTTKELMTNSTLIAKDLRVQELLKLLYAKVKPYQAHYVKSLFSNEAAGTFLPPMGSIGERPNTNNGYRRDNSAVRGNGGRYRY